LTVAVGPLKEVLRPPLLGRTLLGIALAGIPVVGTAANGNWLVPWTDQVAERQAQGLSESGKPTTRKPADPRSKAETQMIRSGGGVFGSLLGGVIAAALGRRLSYFLISLGCLATSTFVFTQLEPLQPGFQAWTFILGF